METEKVYRIFNIKEQKWCQSGLNIPTSSSKRFSPKTWTKLAHAKTAINGNWRCSSRYRSEHKNNYEIHEFEIRPTGKIIAMESK